MQRELLLSVCRSQRTKRTSGGRVVMKTSSEKGCARTSKRVVVSYVTVDPSVGEDSLTYIYGQGNEVRLFKG